MTWYTTECLFRCVHEDHRNRSKQLFERRFFLLHADDDESAHKNAYRLAKSKEHKYTNPDGVRIKWVLQEIIDTKEVLDENLTIGTEVYHKYTYRSKKGRVAH
jgi:hypothetical protein